MTSNAYLAIRGRVIIRNDLAVFVIRDSVRAYDVRLWLGLGLGIPLGQDGTWYTFTAVFCSFSDHDLLRIFVHYTLK
jgi:hypothetical protein